MEGWPASSPDIRSLGSPGVGVECVSEYQDKLDRGGRMFDCSGIVCMVGHEE